MQLFHLRPLRLLAAALLPLGAFTTVWAATPAPKPLTPAETRAQFRKMLDRPRVELNPTVDSSVQGEFRVEHGMFRSEAREDVPFLLIKPVDATGQLPAVVVLHGTGGSKEGERRTCQDLAKRGLLAIAIDARYQGARVPGGAHGASEYNDAIIRAWRASDAGPQEHPLYYDTVWDIWRTLDYLQSRKDVDPKRIGMIGFSMGGIETWMAATDERVAVAVPCIGVQSLKWSLENGQWQGRANTVRKAHEAAAKDLGEPEVNARVCRTLWNKVIPGVLDRFDCPSMLRAIAPRPLLIVNGEKDPNCPVEGAELAIAAAEEEYRKKKAPERLKADIAPGVAHAVTPEQREMAYAWLARWLREPSGR